MKIWTLCCGFRGHAIWHVYKLCIYLGAELMKKKSNITDDEKQEKKSLYSIPKERRYLYVVLFYVFDELNILLVFWFYFERIYFPKTFSLLFKMKIE